MGSDSVQHGRLARADLMSLEQYSTTRKEFRDRVLEHKRNRLIAIGPNVTWAFEDRLTIQYQVQEMLRVERIFEAAGIRDELDAYNPLIPDGSAGRGAFLIEFPDAEERKQRLAWRCGASKTAAGFRSRAGAIVCYCGRGLGAGERRRRRR